MPPYHCRLCRWWRAPFRSRCSAKRMRFQVCANLIRGEVEVVVVNATQYMELYVHGKLTLRVVKEEEEELKLLRIPPVSAD